MVAGDGGSDDNITLFKYDALDNLVAVTDPKVLTTTYTYNALGDLDELSSPDTGTTTYTYDSAGNRTIQVDAKGVVVNYSYDALNRLTSIDYPDNTLDITYSYDNSASGVNGIGRLTGMTDASGTTNYKFDLRGNLTAVETTIDGNSYTTSYNHNGADQLTQITYPSSRTVDYVRDSTGRIDQVTTTFMGTTETVVENLAYTPFGPITGFDYGNGIPVTRLLDDDYRLIATNHGTLYNVAYDLYDEANNIKRITNNLDAGKTQTFNYDTLHRLDDASSTGIYGSLDYGYDSNGNRTLLNDDGIIDIYNYATTSHHLDNITNGIAQSFDYDDNGNTTSNDNYDFTYGDHNRLSEVTNGALSIANYTYNGRGERVKKDTGVVTYYHYNQTGQLIAESDDQGDITKEYIYLDGVPVALTEINNTVIPPVVMDNDDCGFVISGAWALENSGGDFYGANYRQVSPGTGTHQSFWQCNLAAAEEYAVYAQWPAAPDRATDADYTINHANGTTIVSVDQQQNGGQFNLLGTFTLNTNSNINLTDDANGVVVADAIQLVKTAGAGSGAALYYIHPDHLGTPQLITDDTQTPVWQAEYDPFGEATVTISDIINNLRFPGQYFDDETELHYNYFRTYDPSTGRYIESDPIGMRAGLNTYSYVLNNPFLYFDLFGLEKLILFDQNSSLTSNTVLSVSAYEFPDTMGELLIFGHGNFKEMADDRNAGFLFMDRKLLTPEDLANLIKNSDDWKEGMPIRLYSCETAKGEDSFAEQLSKILNTKVSGFENTITILDGKVTPTDSLMRVFGE